MIRDEWTIVLDFLPMGRVGMERAEPVAQVIGEKYFSLLEIIAREGVGLKTGDRVYVGEKRREQVRYIRGRIMPQELTVAAKSELPNVIEKIVDADEARFVEFFNKAGSITMRLHQLELLPGIGQKHLWNIIEERKVKPFESFKDISARAKLLSDPKKMIVRRILDELEEKEKYRLFVAGRHDD